MDLKKIILLYFIINILINGITTDISPNELSALATLESTYQFGWTVGDANEVCTLNLNLPRATLRCNPGNTKLISMVIISPNTPSQFPAVSPFLDLVSLSIDTQDVFLNSYFWNFQLSVYSSLEEFTVKGINLNPPADIGTNFPQSLKSFSIETSFSMTPSLFTGSPNLDTLTIIPIGPTTFPTLSGPSNLKTINYESSDTSAFAVPPFFNPSNNPFFTSLTTLKIITDITDVFTYNSFNTFPALRFLHLTSRRLSPSSFPFPISVASCPLLETLEIGNYYCQAPTIIDFPNTPALYTLSFGGSILYNLELPGIRINPSVNTFIVTPDPLFTNFDNLDLAPYEYIVAENGYLNSLTENSTYYINKNISVRANKITSLPNSFRHVSDFDIRNNLLTSLPTCFQCAIYQWYSKIYPSNAILPDYRIPKPCSTLQIDPITNGIPTCGSLIQLTGYDLGWSAYLIDPITNASLSELIFDYYNFRLTVPIPSGVGSSNTITIKFYPNEPVPTIVSVPYSYSPPTISYLTGVNQIDFFAINGDSFGTQAGLVEITIMDTLYTINTITNDQIQVVNAIPTALKTNSIFQVKIKVADQIGSYFYNELGGGPTINGPLPVLNFTGGSASLSGDFFSIDKSCYTMFIGETQLLVTLTDPTTIYFSYLILSGYGYQDLDIKMGGDMFTSSVTLVVKGPQPTISNVVLSIDGGQVSVPGTWLAYDTSFYDITLDDTFSCVGNGATNSQFNLIYPSTTTPRIRLLRVKISTLYEMTQIVQIQGPIPSLSSPLPTFDILGGQLTLSGVNLGYTPASYILTIDGLPCTVTSTQSNNITFTYPQLPSIGFKDLNLTLTNIYSHVAQLQVTIGPSPIISSLPRLTILGGQNQINGSFFNFGLSNYNLTIDGVTCQLVQQDNIASSYLIFTYPTFTTPGYKTLKLVVLNYYTIQKEIIIDGPQPKFDNPLPTFKYNGGETQLTGLNFYPNISIFSLKIGNTICKITQTTDTTFNFSYPILDQTQNSLLLHLNTANLYDIFEYVNIQGPELPTCQPVTNGKCNANNTLVCNNGWSGPDCSSAIINVNPTFNNTSPDSSNNNSTATLPSGDKVEYSSLISITELREYDGLTGKIINSHIFTKWIVDTIKLNQEYLYSTNITNNNLNTSVIVNMKYFKSQTTIEFGDQNITINPNTLKYQISISEYSFIRSYNRLQLIFDSEIQIDTSVEDSCSVETFGQDPTSSNHQYMKLQLNEISLYCKFIKYGLIDDRISFVSNNILNESSSTIQETNQIKTRIGINIPHFMESVVLDPDFSVLLDSKPASSYSNSKCYSKEEKKSLSKSQIAGIVIGAVLFTAAVALGVSYVVYKNFTKKRELRSLQSRLNEIGQLQK